MASATLPTRLCPRCERAACLCALLPAEPLAHATQLLILQDPGERLQAKGTVPLLRLGLQHCDVRVGERFDPALLRTQRHTLLLYPPSPGDEAPPVISVQPPPEGLRLIVLDGTWRKSRKLLHQNPWLAALPRLSLEVAGAGEAAPGVCSTSNEKSRRCVGLFCQAQWVFQTLRRQPTLGFRHGT